VILEKKDEETLFVDTWFMSCRVLKRGMEHFTLNTLVAYARHYGFRNIVGEYIPTAKNSMVKDHYPGLGFVRVEDPVRHLFRLEVEKYELKECYITTN
jgi:predicted enzyme involved in methoxymalonyl-ACP biosynthesis